MPSDFGTAVSKKALWAGWIISALPGLLLLASGCYGLTGSPKVVEGFVKYGYPAHILRTLCIVEIVCAVLYLVPQTAVLGAILLTGYFGGATATHVRIGEPFFLPIIVGILVWLGLLLRDARVRQLLPLRSVPPVRHNL